MRTGILTIPLELRLQIYSYIHEPLLELDLCQALTETRLLNCSSKSRQSPLLTYMHKRRMASQWAREYGIHLLATNVILAQEYTELVSRSSTLTFHCPKCLTRLLIHLRNDLGLKQPVFKNIRTRVGGQYLSPRRTRNIHITPHQFHLEDAFAAFQLVITRMYGAFSLVYDELDQSSLSDPERKYLVEQVRVVGILPEETPNSQGDIMDIDSREFNRERYAKFSDSDTRILHPGTEDQLDDNLAVFGFGGRRWGSYEILDGVTELDRWTVQWHIGGSGGEPLRRIKRRMRTSNVSASDDEWRWLSRDMVQRLSDERKSYLVSRDELWLSVIL